MKFTPQFSKKMKNSVLRQELGFKLKVSYFTINRRLDDPSNKEFTKREYFNILSEVSGLTVDEIFPKNLD